MSRININISVLRIKFEWYSVSLRICVEFMYKASLCLLLLLVCSCHTRWLGPTVRRLPAALPYKEMHPVDFCQLPTLRNQLVCVRGIYSGIANEYWWFTSVGPPCTPDIGVELTFPDQVPASFQAKIDIMRQYSDTHCLVVDALGRYEDEQTNGYGQLGHNKAQFVVQELIQIQLVTLKRRKVIAVQ